MSPTASGEQGRALDLCCPHGTLMSRREMDMGGSWRGSTRPVHTSALNGAIVVRIGEAAEQQSAVGSRGEPGPLSGCQLAGVARLHAWTGVDWSFPRPRGHGQP